jgi:hypothetical protein
VIGESRPVRSPIDMIATKGPSERAGPFLCAIGGSFPLPADVPTTGVPPFAVAGFAFPWRRQSYATRVRVSAFSGRYAIVTARKSKYPEATHAT